MTLTTKVHRRDILTTNPNVTSLPGYMSPADAHATLVGQVQLPVFFEKLASDWGLVPESEEEAVTMLKMAADLRVAAQSQQVKVASNRLGWLNQLGSELSNAIHGPSAAPTAQAFNQQIKAAAAQIALNPVVSQAYLATLVHQAS